MGFLASSVVVVGMAIVSACLGVVGFLLLNLDLDTSAVLAVAAFVVMLGAQFATWRRQDRSAADAGTRDLRDRIARLEGDVAQALSRASALEMAGAATAAHVASEARATAAELRRDLDEITVVLSDLADTVVALQEPQPVPDAAAPERPALPEPERKGGGRFMTLAKSDRIAMLASAIEHSRLDVLLQPVVTLPQRKIKWYEVHARMRTERGEVILADDAAAIAEEGGLSAQLDRTVLFRSVQLVRRLQARNRDIGLMVPLSAAGLLDGDQFRDVIDYLAANKAIAPSLILQLRQDGYRAFGALELESLGAMTQHGYRFVLDDVQDLRFDARDMADRGARFVKVPADVILGRAGALPADIHVADLPGLLARYGIDLIASRIETESTVVDLLDYDVRYGQGFLFSPPRPVRAEVLGTDPLPERRPALV
jgi:cyclic-di-GMP phosphodiesterase TipF (flagellum assembly factor)